MRRFAKILNPIVMVAALSGLGLALSGCSSSGKRLGWVNEEEAPDTNVDSAAYGADGFTYRKEQTIREPNDFQFYFKHCALSDNQAFYSKTAYWCTDP